MAKKGPTPKERHRAGVIHRWGLRCYAYDAGCSGRVEAAHYISAQRLREEQRKIKLSAYRFALDDPRHGLTQSSLDELIADDRNGIPLCSEHHNAFDGKRAEPLIIVAPACVIEFAQDYGLTHLIEFPTQEETPNAAA